MKFKSSLFLSAALLSGLVYGQNGGDWGVYVSTNCGVGNVQSAKAGADLFIPIHQSNEGMTFIDLRGRGLCENEIAKDNVSFAFGHRHILNNSLAIGGNISYDQASTENGNKVSQVAAGIELFTPNQSFKINIMKGEGKHELEGTGIAPYATIENNRFKIRKKDNDYEGALNGVSFEYDHKFRFANDLDLELGSELYYRDRDGFDSVTGIAVDSTVTKGYSFFGNDAEVYVYGGVDYNDQDGSELFGGIGTRIYFGKKKSSRRLRQDEQLRDMMSQSITRSSAPFIQQYTPAEIAMNAVVEKYSRQFSHYKAITDQDELKEEAANLDNDKTLLTLTNEEGAINITEDVNLADNNVLISGGSAVVVKGPNGETATLILPGSRGSINGSNSAKFTMGSNTIVDGVDFTDTEIKVHGSNDVLINDSTITRNNQKATVSL